MARRKPQAVRRQPAADQPRSTLATVHQVDEGLRELLAAYRSHIATYLAAIELQDWQVADNSASLAMRNLRGQDLLLARRTELTGC